MTTIIIILIGIDIVLLIKLQTLSIKLKVSESFIEYLSRFYNSINKAFSVYKNADYNNKDNPERIKIEAVKTILDICEDSNEVNKEIDKYLNK